MYLMRAATHARSAGPLTVQQPGNVVRGFQAAGIKRPSGIRGPTGSNS